MKKVLLIVLIFFTLNTLSAQGFSKTFLLNYRYLEFYKSILEHDTLVMYGFVITKDSIPKIGVFLSKFDTLGNVISINTYFDKNGDDIAYYPYPRFFKTSDGGYVSILSLFDNAEGIIKFKYDGEVEKVKYYKDFQTKTNLIRFNDILELKDGFFVMGKKDALQTRDSIRLVKFDKNLDKVLWEKTYCDDKLCYYPNAYSCIPKGKNIIIHVLKSDYCQGVDLPKSKYVNVELIVDSLGNKVSETHIKELDKFYSIGSFTTSDKNKVILGDKVVGYTVTDIPIIKHNLVKLDSLNKIVWNKTYSDGTTYYFSSQNYAFETKDKDYISVGATRMNTQYQGQEILNIVGSIYKFDENGNLKWKKTDTIHNQLYKSPKFLNGTFLVPLRSFYGAVELPSGSIIACGYSDKYSLDEAKDSLTDFHTEAWLYKVDKNGCMSPKDCAIVSTKEEVLKASPENISIFPNPTQRDINIKTEKNTIESIEIYDVNAKKLQKIHFETASFEVKITLPENNTPVFLFKIKMSDGSIAIRKVMKI